MKTQQTHQPVVNKLITQLDRDETLKDQLSTQLKNACLNVANTMGGSVGTNPDSLNHFFSALDIKADTNLIQTLNNLSSTEYLDKYYNYLDNMVTMIPREDYVKEVYFKLVQFYYLIGKDLQYESKVIENWMVQFANDWGSFLDSPASLTQETLESFYQQTILKHTKSQDYNPKSDYNLEQYQGYDALYGDGKTPKVVFPNDKWKTFNEFFSRQVLPGLRSISEDNKDDKIICSPADSIYKNSYKINSCSDLIVDGTGKPYKFKYTHQYSVKQLLDSSPYADAFEGGMFIHSFLGPNDYHHFHAPVSGKILEARPIQANVILDVDITNKNDEGKYEFDAPDNTESGYEFIQTRGLIIFDSPIGKVAVLPIGMCQVSSVNMTAGYNQYLNKGDEFGYFKFGGSDIIMLFQKECNVSLIDDIICRDKYHNNTHKMYAGDAMATADYIDIAGDFVESSN